MAGCKISILRGRSVQAGARDGAEPPRAVGMAALGWPTACGQALAAEGKPGGQADGDPSSAVQLCSGAAGAGADLRFSDPGVKRGSQSSNLASGRGRCVDHFFPSHKETV